MFDKTPIEEKLEAEARQRYQHILDLQKRDPDAYRKIPATEKINAARWAEREHGKAMPAATKLPFLLNPQFEELLALREADIDRYEATFAKLPATTRISLTRYAADRRAAGL